MELIAHDVVNNNESQDSIVSTGENGEYAELWHRIFLGADFKILKSGEPQVVETMNFAKVRKEMPIQSSYLRVGEVLDVNLAKAATKAVYATALGLREYLHNTLLTKKGCDKKELQNRTCNNKRHE